MIIGFITETSSSLFATRDSLLAYRLSLAQ